LRLSLSSLPDQASLTPERSHSHTTKPSHKKSWEMGIVISKYQQNDPRAPNIDRVSTLSKAFDLDSWFQSWWLTRTDRIGRAKSGKLIMTTSSSNEKSLAWSLSLIADWTTQNGSEITFPFSFFVAWLWFGFFHWQYCHIVPLSFGAQASWWVISRFCFLTFEVEWHRFVWHPTA
jgi:hypothetical protein